MWIKKRDILDVVEKEFWVEVGRSPFEEPSNRFIVQDGAYYTSNAVYKLIKKLQPEPEHKAKEESELEGRVMRLECVADGHGEWEYGERLRCLPSYRLIKTCKGCGEVVTMTKEDWLQEQADYHCKKHEEFINRINKED